MTSDPGRPLPPAALANYVFGGDARPLEAYEHSGRAIRELLRALLPDDVDLAESRLLDFGCGSGRVLRHFVGEAAELHGCDIHAESIAWAREHLPELQLELTGEVPPLPYADDAFDVIWSLSVFTHLDDTWAAWACELQRVLAPGGVLIVTFMGEQFSERIAGEPWDPDRIGHNALGVSRPWEAGGPMVLTSEWWVRAHWGRAFDLVAWRPGEPGAQEQDTAVFRSRTEVTPTPELLQAPEPGEPRELCAARHHVSQLQRLQRELDRQLLDYVEAYEQESVRRADAERRIEELERALRDSRRRRLRPRAWRR